MIEEREDNYISIYDIQFYSFLFTRILVYLFTYLFIHRLILMLLLVQLKLHIILGCYGHSHVRVLEN